MQSGKQDYQPDSHIPPSANALVRQAKERASATSGPMINPVELHDQIRTLEELPSYDDPAA